MRTLLLTIAPLVCAQSFEVAAIKPHPGEVVASMEPTVQGTRVIGVATSLMDMISKAYGVRYNQITGGPAWIRTERFDLDAKVPGDSAPAKEQADLMMRNLLADRFQLVLHREAKEVPVYHLVADKSGPKLKPSAPDARPASVARGTANGMHAEITKGSMEALAALLTGSAGRPVIDRTGLEGTYTYVLDWFPVGRVRPPDSDVPSIFDALREQLGLRLEPASGMQESLVIDRAEKPSAN